MADHHQEAHQLCHGTGRSPRELAEAEQAERGHGQDRPGRTQQDRHRDDRHHDQPGDVSPPEVVPQGRVEPDQTIQDEKIGGVHGQEHDQQTDNQERPRLVQCLAEVEEPFQSFGSMVS